ncbi:MAG: tRNA 2-selenouridine(34) synthase MnmH [Planctomycetota bacterium]|nr:tRNA 2-selenouridine(34) synthase MnmH [Planctomycetota bacterium]
MSQSTHIGIIGIPDFLDKRKRSIVVDVRAPGEFEQGNILGAINIPLFDDLQRSQVGTVYKKAGREQAIKLGFDLVGPKMRKIVESFEDVCQDSTTLDVSHKVNDVLLYCARGGMRSESVGWLLKQADIQVKRLEGGYKSYRRYCHSFFEKPWNLIALTGMTGAGKTDLLQHLSAVGEQVIDLEGLAHHRGSAFGGIGQDPQPSTESFENLIFESLRSFNSQRRSWVEDESRSVGKCMVPSPFFEQLHSAPAVYLNVDVHERIELLVSQYGMLPKGEMISAIERISKRLGGQSVKSAIAALHENDFRKCAEILLGYYDRGYSICQQKNPRQNVVSVDASGCDRETQLARVLKAADSLDRS